MADRDFLPVSARNRAAWAVWSVAAAHESGDGSDLAAVRSVCETLLPADAVGWPRAAAIHLRLLEGRTTEAESRVLEALERFALYRPEPGAVSSDP